MTDKLLTSKQVADQLAISESTLRKWRLTGGDSSLPFIKVGEAVRYKESALKDWIASRTRSSTSERANAA